MVRALAPALLLFCAPGGLMANDGCAIAVLGYCCVGMMELVTRLDALALWVARIHHRSGKARSNGQPERCR